MRFFLQIQVLRKNVVRDYLKKFRNVIFAFMKTIFFHRQYTRVQLIVPKNIRKRTPDIFLVSPLKLSSKKLHGGSLKAF